MEQLKTPRQIKSEKLKKRVTDHYCELANIEGSNWQKILLIAKKQGVSPQHVARVIKAHKNEQSDNKPSTNS